MVISLKSLVSAGAGAIFFALAANASALGLTEGWFYQNVPVPGETPAITKVATNDALEIFTLSLNRNGTTSYWTTQKQSPFGDKVFATSIVTKSGSLPVDLAVDANGEATIGGIYLDSNNIYQASIYHYDAQGHLMFSRYVTTTSKSGENLIGVGTDQNNDIHMIVGSPYLTGSELVMKTFTHTGTLVSSVTDPTIQPLSAFVDAQGNTFVSGRQATGASQGAAQGREYQAYTATIDWGDSVPDVYDQQTGANTSQHIVLFPGNNAGESIEAINSTTFLPGNPATFIFQVKFRNSSGAPTFTTLTKPGSCDSACADTATSFFVDYDTFASNLVSTPHLECFNGTSHALSFDIQVAGGYPFNLFGSEGGGGVWVGRTDPQTNNLQVANFTSAGSIHTVYTPLAKVDGKPIELSTLRCCSRRRKKGFAVTGNFAAGNGGGIFVSNVMEGVNLAKVTVSSEVGGASGTGTITLNGPAPSGGLGFALFSNKATGGVLLVPPTVFVPAGQTSAPFSLSTAPVATTQTATVTAEGNGVKRDATAKVAAPKLTGVTMDNNTIQGGNVYGGTISLDGAAPAGGHTIAMTSDHPSVIPNANFTVEEGHTTEKFGDLSNKPKVDTTVKLTFTDPDGKTVKTVTVTVLK